MNSYQPLDLEAVRKAARRHDNQWIAQMHNVWRSEEVAQQQLQKNEEVEWHLAVADHNSLINRMNRSEEMVNHTSGHQLANYQMQLGADHLPPPHPPLLLFHLFKMSIGHHHNYLLIQYPNVIIHNIPKARGPYHDPANVFLWDL